MKRLHLTICVLGLILSVAGTATANTWQVVYQTDFSSDPGWTTDQPANYYWDNSMGTYFVHNTNTYPSYYPNRYAGKTMDQPVGSFELQWDIQVTQCDWSSGLYFGVWDNSLEEPWGQGGEFIMVVIGRADGGRVIGFQVGANGAGAYADIYPGWSLNRWYTFKVSYDSDTEVAHLEVLDKLTGAPIWNSTLAVPGGGFTKDLQFLGSNLGMVGRHGYSGISSTAVFNANLDNIVLSVPAIGPVIPPIADAGEDIVAEANEEVTLDGSGSSDPDGQIIKYTWKRLPDGVVIYSGKEPTCQIRALGRVEEVIELTVTDNSLMTATDTVKIINRTTQNLKDQLAALQSQIEQLQQQQQETRSLVDRICAWPPIKWWLRRAIRLGDLNQDGRVNMSDFALLSKDWLH
jgi:hypothetical protein